MTRCMMSVVFVMHVSAGVMNVTFCKRLFRTLPEVVSSWGTGGEHQQPVLRLPIHQLEHARELSMLLGPMGLCQGCNMITVVSWLCKLNSKPRIEVSDFECRIVKPRCWNFSLIPLIFCSRFAEATCRRLEGATDADRSATHPAFRASYLFET